MALYEIRGAFGEVDKRRTRAGAHWLAYRRWVELLSVTGGRDTANGWRGVAALNVFRNDPACMSATLERHGDTVSVSRVTP